MTATQKIMTADELWGMPNDGKRRELVRGELREMAPAGGGHGKITIKLTVPLGQYVERHGLGIVFAAETGFLLTRQPDTVRAPDIAFIAQQRVPKTGVWQGFIPLAPDLAVEVVSPSDRVYEVDEKVQDWLDNGTRLVWVVNPRTRTVTVNRAGSQPKILTESDELTGDDVVPGFTCPVREIFA